LLSSSAAPAPKPPLFPYTTLFRSDVGAHVAAADLARERLREADDPRLRGAVVRLAEVAVDPDDAGDVHDRSCLPLHHPADDRARSEEHTSELQSPDQLVCRLLLEK